MTITRFQVVANTITDKLTVDDARILIESVDEFNRSGNFELVFPVISDDLDLYMSYINVNSGNRYYNSLLVEFMRRFSLVKNVGTADDRPRSGVISSDGLNLLDKYASKLVTGNTPDTLWSPPVAKDLVKSKLALRSSLSELSANSSK